MLLFFSLFPALGSWADKVRFGQAKVQVVAPTKKIINQNTTKKAVPKPQVGCSSVSF